MVDAPETTNDDLAKSLFASLTDGADFSLPSLDLTDASFTTPVEAGNDLYDSLSSLTLEDLTTGVVDGDGTFDGIMSSLNAHLKKEYETGRITGNDYAQAYVGVTTTALSTAVQYLLAKDQAHWQAHLAQKQSQAAEIAVIQARAALEMQKAQLIQVRMNANTAAAEYALAKLRLTNENVAYDIQEAQLGKITYEVDYLMPAQLDQMAEQTSQITAQKDQVLFQTTNILVEQEIGLQRDNAIKLYQHDNLLPAQKLDLDADTDIKVYNRDFILPAQKDSLDEQMESHRAKTMSTRSDGVTVVAGAIGKQMELQDQQIHAYISDGQFKLTKAMLDTWSVDKSIDEGVTTPSSVNNTAIDATMATLKTTLNM
jgi:hypothetical protein